jgi:hypothetical protein
MGRYLDLLNSKVPQPPLQPVAADWDVPYVRPQPGGDPVGPDEMLHMACMHLRDEHVDLLLSKGAGANWADPLYGYSALHIAAQNGRAYQLARLLDAGADTTFKDTDGNIPLQLVRRYHPKSVSLELLEVATPPDAVPKDETTPLPTH